MLRNSLACLLNAARCISSCKPRIHLLIKIVNINIMFCLMYFQYVILLFYLERKLWKRYDIFSGFHLVIVKNDSEKNNSLLNSEECIPKYGQ